MRIVYFTHSLLSCWNHGNAHFVRGVLRALTKDGHDVVAYEPANSWSLANLLQDHGNAALDPYWQAYPELVPRFYDDDAQPEALCDGADLVIVHEWNEPDLVATLGRLRREGSTFRLLFHDTHHRAVSDPQAIQAFDLDGYDGILAFGEALAEVYRRWGWEKRVFVWHEAADIDLFRPPADEKTRSGIVWVGNWGDGERSDELTQFLFRPTVAVGMFPDIYGVRYPDEALTTLAKYGVRYRGWLANARVPEVFGTHLATIHVPRRFYVSALPGIPTIRMFEALACGIPLLTAPWKDTENLFRPGVDYLMAQNGTEMVRHLKNVRDDGDLRTSLAANGLETIRTRHSCAHRARELISIVQQL